MRKIYTILLILLFAASNIFAAAPPTVPASNLLFSSVQGGKFSVRYTNGNGSGRIVVMKAGSPVTGTPVNGIQYNYNAAFGTAGSEFINDGEFVIYRGGNNILTVTNLLPATTYYISVFEYNGSGATTEYLMIPLSGSQATVSAPTSQAHSIAFSNIIGNSVKISWTNGNGENRLVLARKGAPVNATPVNLTEYSSSAEFGSGAALNGDNYAVFKQTGNNVTLTKLEPNTQYHFAVFEFNGSNTPVYLTPAATGSVTTLAGPTQSAGSVSVSSREGNRLTFSASGGNGSKKLFVVKKNSPVTSVPVNGTVYNASPVFGTGEQLAAGEYVVSSTTNLVTVTNLEPSTTYYVRVFEFDVDAANNTYYLTATSAANNFSTATPPTQVSGIHFLNVNGSSMTVKFTGGNGNYRMLIMKEGAPVDAEPEDLTRYDGNGNFGQGEELGTGNFVIVDGVNGTNINVLNLQPGKTYHVAMHEFNGNNYPVYARPAATASVTIPNEPTTPASGFYKNAIEGNSFRANWTSGDGSRRIVIAKKGTAVTALPVDNTVYTAHANFGQGQEIAPGEYIVYDGPHMNVEIKNLEVNSLYHVAVFEYNTSASGPDYLVSTYLAGNASTLAPPTIQASGISASNILSNQATISFNAGNGAARMFVMKKGGPVDSDPLDLVSYSTSTVFGSGSEIGTGNFVLHKTAGTSDFTVSNLQSNTTYHIAAYEYFGSTGIVFLRPGAAYNFTTLPAAGDITPTLPATDAVISNVEGNKLKLDWENGNGSHRIVVARQGATISSLPVNGVTYTANSVFGTGADIGDDEFVVYNGNGSGVTITNLLPYQIYHLAVFEYNGNGASTSYLSSAFLSTNASTLSAPTEGSSIPVATNLGNGLRLEWVNGNGHARLVVVRDGAAITSSPLDLNIYPPNAAFGNGSQIGAGEYVVFAGTGNSVTVTGLVENHTYHYSIFEYNGTEGPVYNVTDVTSGSAVVSSTLPVKWAYFRAEKQTASSVLLKWGTWQEDNSAYFVVERNGGNGFMPLDTVAAAGNSSTPKHYSYTDAIGYSVTYRIKQVDSDGHFSYSHVIQVLYQEGNEAISIYPNPASEKINIRLANEAPAVMQIVNSGGQVVSILPVTNNQEVEVSRLLPGVYYLVFTQNGRKQTITLVRQ